MKKTIITTLFVLVYFTVFSQISLENTVDGALFSVELEDVGKKYFIAEYVNNQCIIYNTDYSTYKTIDIAVPSFYWLYEIVYVSTKVFDNDDEVELLAVYQSYVYITDTTGYYVYQIRVIDEDGSLMLDIPNGGYSTVISNGPDENKLLVFVYDFSVSPYLVSTNIYSIYGFPVSLPDELSFSDRLNAYPNPAHDRIIIPYEIDNSINDAEIIISNVNGVEIAIYKVNINSKEMSLNVSAYSKGLYFYNLRSGSNSLQKGKFIKQ